MQSSEAYQIEAAVLDAFKSLVQACRDLDAAAYFSHFDHEKFTGLNTDGKVWHSVQALHDLIGPGFAMVEKVVSLEFFNVKVTAINHLTAILVNEYKETSLLKNGSLIEQAGGGAQVWCKSGEIWKLVSFSASEAKGV